MIHIISLIKTFFPKFGIKEITEADFWRVVKQERIFVHFWKLKPGVKGFYGVNRKYKIPRRYIVINLELLTSGNWLKTAIHELMHHILHVPVSDFAVFFSADDISEEQDREAEDMMLIGMITRSRLLELQNTPPDEIYGWTNDELIRRVELFEVNKREF